MSKIDLSGVKRWQKPGGFYIPLGADYRCPHCNKSTHHHRIEAGAVDNLHEYSTAVKMECSRCAGISLLWCLGISQTVKTARAIYLSPDNSRGDENRNLSDFEGGVVPTRVLDTYKDAIASFEAGIWDAAGTLCGKALEGAVKSKLPPEKANVKGGLAVQLTALESNTNLTNPFSQVTKAIRVGRNVSAHFDETVKIDEDTAKALLDLVEYVLEFLYVYEKRAASLSTQIDSLSGVTSPADAAASNEA